MSELVQLLYVSRAAGPARILAPILAASEPRNAVAEITGCLLAGPSWFVQVLEGPDAAVAKTYERIARDARHTDLVVLGTRPLRQRSFPRWSMSGRTLGVDPGGLLARHGLRVGFDPADMPMPALLALSMDLQDSEHV